MSVRLPFVRFVLLALSLAACGGVPVSSDGGGSDASSEGGSAPSFTRDIAPIFARSCALAGSCHGTGSSVGLALLGDARASIVGAASTEAPMMLRVRPGSPEQSFLFRKIEGTHGAGIYCPTTPGCGTRMPMVGGTGLPLGEIELIRVWIASGAP